MSDVTPHQFRKEMNFHLAVHSKVANSKEIYARMSADIESLADQEQILLEKYSANHKLISDLVETYQGLLKQKEESYLSKELDEINAAKAVRATMDQEVLLIRKKANILRNDMYHFRPEAPSRGKWNESESYLNEFNNKAALYSIISLETINENLTFMLVGKDIDGHAYMRNLSLIKDDTPIGRACKGRRVGSIISYQAPNGLELEAKILECSLPSVEQIDELIQSIEPRDNHSKAQNVDPFYLHDLYDSNNSRRRKGG
jgi:hypothetical protein